MNWTPRAVRSFRDEFNVTRTRFGRLLSVDERTIARWEAGDSTPQGASAALLDGLREVLLEEDDAGKRERIKVYVLEASDVGGIAYLLAKLLKERFK